MASFSDCINMPRGYICPKLNVVTMITLSNSPLLSHMNRFHQIITIITLGLLCPLVMAQDSFKSTDPAQIYYNIYIDIKSAEKLEEKGEFSDAWQKYSKAAKYLDNLQQFHEDWRKDMVARRIKSTSASIEGIKAKVAQEVADKKNKNQEFVEGGQFSIPDPTQQEPLVTGHLKSRPQNTPKAPVLSNDRRVQDQIRQLVRENDQLEKKLTELNNKSIQSSNQNLATSNQLRQLQQLIDSKNREIANMRNQLAQAPVQKDIDQASRAKDRRVQEQIRQLVQENNQLEKKLIELNDENLQRSNQNLATSNQLKQLQQLIDSKNREITNMRNQLARAPIQQDIDRANREKEAREKELTITAQALKRTKNKLDSALEIAEQKTAAAAQAQSQIEEITKQMSEQQTANNAIIDVQRNELKNLNQLLENTRQELGQSKEEIDQLKLQLTQASTIISELTEERNALLTERDMLSNILSQKDSEGVQKLIEENVRLGTSLKQAEERITFLHNSQNTTKDELLDAKTSLAIAKTRIIKYQEKISLYDQRVSTIEAELRDAQAALKNASANPSSPADHEEIEVLRSTVKRLIAAQERRRIGDELLWEAYQKSNTVIPGVQSAFDDIRQTNVVLSEQEKGIIAKRQEPDQEFTSPQRVPLEHAKAHADALEQEIDTFMPYLADIFDRGSYEAAREILLSMDERFPGHLRILCIRGLVELKTKNYNEAGELFSEAITMNENGYYAHYMLGLTKYKEGKDYDGALNAFQQSLELQPNNEKAHLYLGCIAGLGNRFEQSEKHFLSAIQLDPNFADAYFNLSAIYIKQGRKQDAQSYYKKALDHGKTPNSLHEKAISNLQG